MTQHINSLPPNLTSNANPIFYIFNQSKHAKSVVKIDHEHKKQIKIKRQNLQTFTKAIINPQQPTIILKPSAYK